MTVSLFDFDHELQACAAGDHSALLNLYRHESGLMYTLALAMLGNPQDAHAVVHETFVLVWRNAAGYSPSIGTARAWIYSILRHRARAYRPATPGSAYPPMLPQLDFPEEQAGSGVAESLRALPAPQREALLAAYLHGGDAAQIAARLDRTEPDIRASLEAALNRLNDAVHA